MLPPDSQSVKLRNPWESGGNPLTGISNRLPATPEWIPVRRDDLVGCARSTPLDAFEINLPLRLVKAEAGALEADARRVSPALIIQKGGVMRKVLCGLVSSLYVASFSSIALAQRIMEVEADPVHYKVELDNDCVYVARASFGHTKEIAHVF